MSHGQHNKTHNQKNHRTCQLAKPLVPPVLEKLTEGMTCWDIRASQFPLYLQKEESICQKIRYIGVPEEDLKCGSTCSLITSQESLISLSWNVLESCRASFCTFSLFFSISEAIDEYPQLRGWCSDTKWCRVEFKRKPSCNLAKLKLF